MKSGTYYPVNSDLYVKVHKVHYVNQAKNYVKLSMTTYYKSSNKVCYWINPTGQRKNFKLKYDVVKSWR